MPNSIYCVKCKRKTDSKNPTASTTSNGRKMIRAQCSNCNSKKCVFTK